MAMTIALLVTMIAAVAHGRVVTFSNRVPRITSSGNLSGWNMTGEIIDSHSNVVVQVNTNPNPNLNLNPNPNPQT